jgi:hypothetical protein
VHILCREICLHEIHGGGRSYQKVSPVKSTESMLWSVSRICPWDFQWMVQVRCYRYAFVMKQRMHKSPLVGIRLGVTSYAKLPLSLSDLRFPKLPPLHDLRRVLITSTRYRQRSRGSRLWLWLKTTFPLHAEIRCYGSTLFFWAS